MARPGKRAGKLPPFVALSWSMLNSPAYKKMPHSVGHALPYWLGKVKRPYNDPAFYTTQFSFSYAEAKQLGFASSTWAGVIKAVVAFGFVDPVDKGGLRGDGLSCNLFKLSKRWQEYGKPSFKQVEWNEYFPRKAV
jgi:hypothetical protein